MARQLHRDPARCHGCHGPGRRSSRRNLTGVSAASDRTERWGGARINSIEHTAVGPSGGIQLAPARRLDHAFATLQALPADVLLRCLYRSAAEVPIPDLLREQVPMARWIESDAHPFTYLDPAHHDRARQAWLDACEGTDRVGHAVVRTVLPLTDGQDQVVAPPGWYRATIVDCTDADGLDVIVFGLEPSSEGAEQDHLAGVETEPGDRTSWFGGTTAFSLRLDVDAIVRGGTMNVSEVLGRPLVDLLGRAFVEFAHPDDLPGAEVAWRSILEDPSRPAVVRTRLATTDRGWRWFEATAWNLLETAKYDAAIVEFRDVDDLVAIELARAAAAREHSRLLRIFDEVDDRGSAGGSRASWG